MTRRQRALLLILAIVAGGGAAIVGLEYYRSQQLADVAGVLKRLPTAHATVLHLDVVARSWPIERAAAVFCANMIHIAPWQASEGLFAGAGRILSSGAPMILYGPFKRHGAHTAPSNEAFDVSLKARDSRWGVRCLDTEVAPLAEPNGLAVDEIVEMPANNLSVVFRRC